VLTLSSWEDGRVLLLLPPSETKTRPDEHAPVLDLEALAHPQLTSARRTVLRAVARTTAGRGAAEHLGVPPSAPELVDRMARIEAEPAGPALGVYSGVLYDQLDPSAAVPRDRRVLVASALLGLVDAAHDRIPAYRLSASSRLHRLGTAGPWWSAQLRPLRLALLEREADDASPLVIDARSGAYRSMLPLRTGHGVRVLAVSPVQQRGETRTVVSHDAKRYRGLVTRELLATAEPPADADALVDLLRPRLASLSGAGGRGLRVELDGDRLVIVDPVE